VNFPEQEYKDVFGGTMGQAEQKEFEENTLGLYSGTSKAMQEYAQQSRAKGTLKDTVLQVRSLNEKAGAKAESKSPISS
jgi:hypothetical protein